jgi:hypothetical protein
MQLYSYIQIAIHVYILYFILCVPKCQRHNNWVQQGVNEASARRPACYTLYIQWKKFSDDQFSCNTCPILTWRAWRHVELPVAVAKISWIHVLDIPMRLLWMCGAVAWAERKSIMFCFDKAQDWLLKCHGYVSWTYPCGCYECAVASRGRRESP